MQSIKFPRLNVFNNGSYAICVWPGLAKKLFLIKFSSVQFNNHYTQGQIQTSLIGGLILQKGFNLLILRAYMYVLNFQKSLHENEVYCLKGGFELTPS